MNSIPKVPQTLPPQQQQQSQQKQQHGEARRFNKRKVYDDSSSSSSKNDNSLGFIGCGIVTSKDYFSHTPDLGACWSKSNEKDRHMEYESSSNRRNDARRQPTQHHELQYFYPKTQRNSIPNKRQVLNYFPNESQNVRDTQFEPKRNAKYSNRHRRNHKYSENRGKSEPRIVQTESNSNIVVKIVNNTTNNNTINGTNQQDNQESVTSNKVAVALNPATSNFDVNWIHSREKYDKASSLYESYLKSAAASGGCQNQCLEKQLSKLSLESNTSNQNKVTNTGNVKQTTTPRSNNRQQQQQQPVSHKNQHRWFRHKRANRSKDEFEHSNEFWEDEEFLLNIGENPSFDLFDANLDLKLADSDGIDV